jgi:hypothetical protein
MRLTNNIGMVLLAIWLILMGLLPLLSINIAGIDLILAILAIAAGVLILLRPTGGTRRLGSIRLSGNLGMILLAIWLIITGLLPLLSLNIPAIGTVLALLAIAAGVLILLGR